MTSERKILSEREAAAIIEDFEKRHELFSVAVDGISIWRLLRFEIGMQLQNLGLNRIPIARTTLIASLPRAALQYAAGRQSFGYLCKTSNSALRGLDDRGYYDVYFDDLIDGIPGGAKMSSIDAGGYGPNENGAYRKPVFDDTAVIVVSAVLGRLARAQNGTREFQNLSSLIVRELDLPTFTPKHIERKYSVFVRRRMLYRHVLKRFGARSVLVTNTGQFALRMAARDMGIPFVEMQHGLFTRDHPDCLPSYALESPADVMLPDLLAVYGANASELIAETAIARANRVRRVGKPVIEAGRRIRERDFRPNSKKPVITLTAQGLGDQETANFLSRFLKSYSGDLTLNVRLHPGYDSLGDFASSGLISDKRVRILPGQSMPSTHEIIALSDVHLSVFSTCHYDALGIGTPTMVIPGAGHQAVSELYGRGHAKLLSSPDELCDIVGHARWAQVPETTRFHFFEQFYLENMRAILNDLETLESGCSVRPHDQ